MAPSGSRRSNKATKKLSSGRPPASRTTGRTLSSKATRTIIRSHHQLHKALADAEQAGDSSRATALRAQMDLESYQQASLQGQARDRGGDTSKLLVDWLKPILEDCKLPLRLLEVGALSTANACSKHSKLAVKRIDLHSQTAGIEQQDFMERPLPSSGDDSFDIISLSLVLNYVPKAADRGEMLKRTCSFLTNEKDDQKAALDKPSRYLFLVLPAPCVTNSRYMNEDLLAQIMTSLGYSMSERKCTSRLVYYLWLYEPVSSKPARFSKQEVSPGRARNNFSIVVE